MVRLVVLTSLFLLLSACSNMRPIESQEPELDAQNTLEQGTLNQGTHHPAVQSLFNKAEKAHQNRNFNLAFKYLDQARQIQPRNAEVFYRQGLIKLKQGQPQKAKQLLLRAKTLTQDENLLKRINSLLNTN